MYYLDPIAIVSLIGALISCLSTGGVILCFAVYRKEQRSFRHALVFNLALSDFLNSLTNSVSGLIYVQTRAELRPGPACTVDGWIQLVSVQATDLSIAAIAASTLMAVTRPRSTATTKTSWTRKLLLCLAVWALPLILGSAVAAAGGFGPSAEGSQSWCWIAADRPGLRYASSDAWRDAVVVATVGIYAYIWWYLRRHFRSMDAAAGGHASSTHDGYVEHSRLIPPAPSHAPRGAAAHAPSAHNSSPWRATRAWGRRVRPPPRQLEVETKRMLLLNGYPIMYLLLWAPVIVNRVMEYCGYTLPGHTSAALRCPAQFVGFANALTYGLSKDMRERLARDVFCRDTKKGMERG